MFTKHENRPFCNGQFAPLFQAFYLPLLLVNKSNFNNLLF